MLNLTEPQINKIIRKQREIEFQADVTYQCYYLNLKESEFWRLQLWNDLEVTTTEEKGL